MKKFLLATSILLMICAQTLAMQLDIDHPPATLTFFDGEFTINGTKLNISSPKRLAPDFYVKHCAGNTYCLGDGENFITLELTGEYELSDVTDYGDFASEPATFYLLKQNTPPGDAIKILGKANGRFAVLLDVEKTFRDEIGWNFFCKKIIPQGDKIIFRYEVSDMIVDGVCTWNSADQSFHTEVIWR